MKGMTSFSSCASAKRYSSRKARMRPMSGWRKKARKTATKSARKLAERGAATSAAGRGSTRA